MPASETPTNPRTPLPPRGEDESISPTSADHHLGPDADADDSSEFDAVDGQEDSSGELRGGRSDSRKGIRSGSRYLDYDSHELLEKISQYEDERRWQRIREGIWISLILHFILFSGLTWIPRYVFHQPQVIDPFDAIKKRKDLTYLDELPDALKEVQKAKPKLKPNDTVVDKKTLDALRALQKTQPKPAPPKPAAPQKAETTPPPTVAPLPQTEKPAPLPPPTPQPTPQVAFDAPRPSPVPARPNFSQPVQTPEDQLRQAMKSAEHGSGGGGGVSGGSIGSHSGTGGAVDVLSDMQGVDFGPYLQKVIRETYRTWYPLIPEEVNPPILKKGQAEIVFTILPNGRLQPHAMILSGRSGDVALDRAAWGAIEGADYPPLPREFHGPYLQLRFRFQYNLR